MVKIKMSCPKCQEPLDLEPPRLAEQNYWLRAALMEFTKFNGVIGVRKKALDSEPCENICQDCGYDKHSCQCQHNQIVEFIEALRRTPEPGNTDNKCKKWVVDKSG